MTRYDIQIRLAESKDIEVLAEFNIAIARQTEQMELAPATVTAGVKRLLDNPQYGFYIVAEAAGQVIGCLMVTYEWSDWRCGLFWWIQSVYVRPEFRRQRVFKQMYEFLRQRAGREPDVCGFRLYFEQSNTVAQAAYAKVGLKRTSYGVLQREFRK